MWGVGPATRARLAEIGVLTIGQLAKTPGWSLERLLGPAAGEKLAALAWNRDPREIKTRRRARSAGAQSALGRKPAEERIFRPALLHLADRIGSRLRAKSRPVRTVTVRVRFANLNSVTRSVTLDAPISATMILAELAEELVRALLADHPHEKTISLLAISVSHLEEDWPRHQKRHGTWGGRPCRRQDPRSLRVGCHRIRIGGAGHLSFRSRRVSQARRKGPVTVTSTRAAKDACF